MSYVRNPSSPDQLLWWQRGIIYQIYPRSFKDSNGDGIGDLGGITSKLDYLRWLGVDALWLSPIYPSPMADFGYDITDYTGIHPLFGAMEDFDTLLQEAHQRDLKVLVDFVPNHTSDEHPWFVESRSSRTNPKRDWYIWRDPAPGGGPPNNWESNFGGPAWAFDPATEQYYLHLFDTKQPDLNWRNPLVRLEMYSVMRFWLERGVDGLRVDVLSQLLKDDQFRDNPLNPDWKDTDPFWSRQLLIYTGDLPEMQEIVREMRRQSDSYADRVLLGELYLPLPRLIRYYGEALDGTHLPFNFQLVLLPAWSAPAIRQIVDAYEAALPAGAWPNWVLGNHDKRRIATRVGLEQARVAQMLLLTLRGTPTCYYGDELGMQDVTIPPHLAQDPQGKIYPELGRDPARTPMLWDNSPNAGFCSPSSSPWLPLSEDYARLNVAAQQSDSRSFLTFTQRLIAFRRGSSALSGGSYQPVDPVPDSCFVYLRQAGNQRFLIALNCSGEEQRLRLSGLGNGDIVLSTHLDRAGAAGLEDLRLRGHEGCLIALTRN